MRASSRSANTARPAVLTPIAQASSRFTNVGTMAGARRSTTTERTHPSVELDIIRFMSPWVDAPVLIGTPRAPLPPPRKWGCLYRLRKLSAPGRERTPADQVFKSRDYVFQSQLRLKTRYQ